MFQLPRYVIKAGRVIVEQGEIRETPSGETLHVAPSYDPADVPHIAEWFEQNYSLRFRNYPVSDSYVPHARPIACR